MPNLDILFKPYRLNALTLPNRVVMAPMTRSMSPGGVPNANVASVAAPIGIEPACRFTY